MHGQNKEYCTYITNQGNLTFLYRIFACSWYGRGGVTWEPAVRGCGVSTYVWYCDKNASSTTHSYLVVDVLHEYCFSWPVVCPWTNTTDEFWHQQWIRLAQKLSGWNVINWQLAEMDLPWCKRRGMVMKGDISIHLIIGRESYVSNHVDVVAPPISAVACIQP